MWIFSRLLHQGIYNKNWTVAYRLLHGMVDLSLIFPYTHCFLVLYFRCINVLFELIKGGSQELKFSLFILLCWLWHTTWHIKVNGFRIKQGIIIYVPSSIMTVMALYLRLLKNEIVSMVSNIPKDFINFPKRLKKILLYQFRFYSNVIWPISNLRICNYWDPNN